MCIKYQMLEILALYPKISRNILIQKHSHLEGTGRKNLQSLREHEVRQVFHERQRKLCRSHGVRRRQGNDARDADWRDKDPSTRRHRPAKRNGRSLLHFPQDGQDGSGEGIDRGGEESFLALGDERGDSKGFGSTSLPYKARQEKQENSRLSNDEFCRQEEAEFQVGTAQGGTSAMRGNVFRGGMRFEVLLHAATSGQRIASALGNEESDDRGSLSLSLPDVWIQQRSFRLHEFDKDNHADLSNCMGYEREGIYRRFVPIGRNKGKCTVGLVHAQDVSEESGLDNVGAKTDQRGDISKANFHRISVRFAQCREKDPFVASSQNEVFEVDALRQRFFEKGNIGESVKDDVPMDSREESSNSFFILIILNHGT